MTVNNAEVKLVLEKLDGVQLELFRLRALLLPEEEVSEGEKKRLDVVRKEIGKCRKISLDDSLKLGKMWE